LILLLAGAAVFGQNAPVTTAATVGGVAPGGMVDVPVTVTGFNNIGAVSLTIDYNYAVMQFTGATPHPALSNFPAGDLNLGTGYHRITMGWYGGGTTLPDGSAIMTLHFAFTGGITPLTWQDNGPSCEYADGNYNVLNDIPTASYYLDGSVCGNIGNPGPITGDNTLCEGSFGVAYSVAPVTNATGYDWTVPAGASITGGVNTNAITVDFPEGSSSGDITVSGTNDCSAGPPSSLAVTVNLLPIADAGDDFAINYGTSTTLSAAGGGSGSYYYHWEPASLLVNPNVQNPQTVILTATTVFTVTVTDQATLCQSDDEVVVVITGGPLNINPLAVPPVICQGESSQLYSNAGGGSGDYTYYWTCDPPGSPAWSSSLPNPVVSPDSSRQYLLTVDDGYTVQSGSTFVAVNPLPTATLSGSDTLCGEGLTTTLTVDLTGTPPWDFTYTWGSTSVTVENQFTTPYYIITGDPGDYTISALSDANCTGNAYGTAIVRTYPIPATPEITVYYSELISSSCCGNQWYRNDTLLPGATGQTYQVYVSGSYTVVVTLNGCSSDPSEPVDMLVGFGENASPAGFSFYPNPARDRVTVHLSRPEKKETFTLSLCSASGTVIRTYEFDNQVETKTIDISDLASGLYFLRLSGSNIQRAGKLMIE